MFLGSWVIILIKLSLSIILVLVAFVCLLQCAMSSINKNISEPPSVSTALNWFPEDIETVAVYRDFEVPKLPVFGEEPAWKQGLYLRALLPLFASVGIEDLCNNLIGQKVILSIEGSKNFRGPNGKSSEEASGEGTSQYDGCHIIWFKDPLPKNFLIGLQKSGSLFEYKGHNVQSIPVGWCSVYQKATIYVTSPGDSVLLVATDKMFLQTVLDRIDSKESLARRALPDSLPEWKYLDTNKKYWSLRHVPDSSKGKTILDGVVAQLNDSDVSSLTVSVLSRDWQAGKKILQRHFWGEENERPLVKRGPKHLWTFCPKSNVSFSGFAHMLDDLTGHILYL